MTRPQPRLSQIPLWERHVDLVLAVLRDALHILSKRWPTGTEIERNRILAECLLFAIRDRYSAGLSTIDSPLFNEAPNQPAPETAGESAERKIPDFQHAYIDHLAPDPLYSSRSFVIECKRLGEATSAGWKLNENYVDNGIMRFVDPAFRYGNNVKSGAMVGYVDGMSFFSILEAVNVKADARGLPLLLQSVQTHPLNELHHQLDRAFPESPFGLAHLWIAERGGDAADW
jgi:hypothetical protein